ncbi:MAG TPA: amidohydrolase, partial [Dehalococcoidia bacterium]
MVSQVLSADSHILEPPDLWTTRMEKRFRDKAPHVVKDFNGQKGDFFVCQPLRPFNPFQLGCAGVAPEKMAELAASG